MYKDCTSHSGPVCLEDIEEKAKKNLSESRSYFFGGGADEEQTLRDNIEAFRR